MSTIDKIAGQVGKAMKSAGMTKPATLVKMTQGVRAPGSASRGVPMASASYTARGLVLASPEEAEINGAEIEVGDRVILLFGALTESLAVPSVGDDITIEGITSRIVSIDRDPASATYTCLTRI